MLFITYMQGSTVHSIKKYHRNMKLGVDDERIENTLPYINKTDEFWDYERQVWIDCSFYLRDLRRSICKNPRDRSTER